MSSKILVRVSEVEFNDVSHQRFWNGVLVYIKRPHILNRRIFGVEIIGTFKLVNINNKDDGLWQNVLDHVLSSQNSEDIEDLIRKAFLVFRIDETSIEEELLDAANDDHEVIIQFRNMIPKSVGFRKCSEVLLMSPVMKKIAFIPREGDLPFPVLPSLSYEINVENSKLFLSVHVNQLEEIQVENVCVNWLKSVFLRKIANWSRNAPKKTPLISLSQICPKSYKTIYNELKTKYGKSLTEIWPEKTDPIKYVYEDIAIGAYIMTLWEEERKLLQTDKKQSFVDVGCGNGLLVHILSSEGYPGIGIDLIKRKIWDFYGKNTNLVEKLIVPSDVSFSEYDWLIGNHSDELTPWIPWIAARSSYECKVFLLPCCPYSFFGKFRRQNSASSCYESYLVFIQELCQQMGYNVVQDKLRIPSTKRVCFICRSRSYAPEEEERVDKIRSLFIKQHQYCNVSSKNAENDDIHCAGSSSKQTANFTPREKVTPIRNCSTLDRTFLQETVVKVMHMLLNQEDYIEVEQNGEKVSWNCGGSLPLASLADALEPETLHKLKNQCGGVQTLLKNHKNLFKVHNGEARLRVPGDEQNSSTKPNRRKKKNAQKKNQVSIFSSKPCIFHFHHPDGCPFSDCQFSHQVA